MNYEEIQDKVGFDIKFHWIHICTLTFNPTMSFPPNIKVYFIKYMSRYCVA